MNAIDEYRIYVIVFHYWIIRSSNLSIILNSQMTSKVYLNKKFNIVKEIVMLFADPSLIVQMIILYIHYADAAKTNIKSRASKTCYYEYKNIII